MMKALLADREFYVKKLLVEGGGKMFDDFSDVELMELYYKVNGYIAEYSVLDMKGIDS